MSKSQAKGSSSTHQLLWPLFVWLIALVGFLLDQLTKHWVVSHLTPYVLSGDRLAVIPNFLYIISIQNTGAGFGILAGKQWILISIGLLTLSFLLAYRKQIPVKTKLEQATLGFFIAGLLGNLTDRIRQGYVVDFIHIHSNSFNIPSFNIADTCLAMSVFLWIVLSYQEMRSAKNSKTR